MARDLDDAAPLTLGVPLLDAFGIERRHGPLPLVLGEDLDAVHLEPDRFEHVAFYNRDESRIEMHLQATEEHSARLEALDLDVAFEADERMRTEVSCKYSRSRVECLLESAGLELEHWFTDDDEAFALSLARPR